MAEIEEVQDVQEEPETLVKPKRKISEKQKDALRRGRQKAAENRAKKKQSIITPPKKEKRPPPPPESSSIESETESESEEEPAPKPKKKTTRPKQNLRIEPPVREFSQISFF